MKTTSVTTSANGSAHAVSTTPSAHVVFSDGVKPLSADLVRELILEDSTANAAPRAVALADKVLRDSVVLSWGGGSFQKHDLVTVVERILLAEGELDTAQALVNRHFPARGGREIVVDDMRVIRRNGSVAPWNTEKIAGVVQKALDSAKAGSVHRGFAARIATNVVSLVQGSHLTKGLRHIHVEEIQGLVEQAMTIAWAGSVDRAPVVFDAIKEFIGYRSQRALERDSGSASIDTPDLFAEAGQMEQLAVLAEDGESFMWNGADLRARINFAMVGLDLIYSPVEIEQRLRVSLFESMNHSDIKTTVMLNARTLVEDDADFGVFCGRMMLTFIYEEVLGWDILEDGPGALKDLHRAKFIDYIKRGVQIGRLSDKALTYDLSKLAELLDPARDLEFNILGIQTLYDRYLIIDKTENTHRRLETPQFFWMRVAMGLFLGEESDREKWVSEYYGMISRREFCPSTPTLFNSMTKHSQLSSCYLYYIDDSLEGIFGRGIMENAQLSKWAGGLGGSWTAVRGTGAHIAGTNGESQGVIPFLKIHNDQLVAVNQGGKRKGSGCAYLESWHNDIFEFLELRKNTGDDRRRTHDMNTANWIPDLFMKRMEARQHWTLFRSSEVADLHELYGKKFEEAYVRYEQMAEEGKIHGQRIQALDLWKKMLSMLFETGHPWITFKDACNIGSPQDHAGVIHSSNLCTEITLNTSKDETAVCNLGSVIICHHLKDDGTIDLVKLRETVRLAMRGLDNVIDLNFYPTEAARRSNSRHRPVGMGVMGLADALYRKALPFDSSEAREFNDEMMEAIAFHAYEASSDLAAERGTYSSFKGSKWHRGILPPDIPDLLESERGTRVDVPRGGKLDWAPLREKIARQGMRNSNCLAIAPTATISNITGVSPCIEPTYKNMFVKSNLSGDFTILNVYLIRDLKARGLWNMALKDELKYYDGELVEIASIPADLKAIYRTAFGIPPEAVIDAATRRQKWIDQSQSLNLWLASPNMKTLSHMFRRLWKGGGRTSYYLRTLGASSIEKATVSKKGGRSINADTGSSFTEEEKRACSIEAMRNGEECEACS